MRLAAPRQLNNKMGKSSSDETNASATTYSLSFRVIALTPAVFGPTTATSSSGQRNSKVRYEAMKASTLRVSFVKKTQTISSVSFLASSPLTVVGWLRYIRHGENSVIHVCLIIPSLLMRSLFVSISLYRTAAMISSLIERLVIVCDICSPISFHFSSVIL